MKTSIKVFHWSPRIICILAILFVSIFATDAFSPGLSIWQQLGGFIIQLIPSFILLAFLFVAWKWELLGGIILLVTGLALSPFIFTLNHNRNHFSVGASLGVVMMITFPFVVVGILFIISNYLKKKELSKVS
jgi:hypothetical protein